MGGALITRATNTRQREVRASRASCGTRSSAVIGRVSARARAADCPRRSPWAPPTSYGTSAGSRSSRSRRSLASWARARAFPPNRRSPNNASAAGSSVIRHRQSDQRGDRQARSKRLEELKPPHDQPDDSARHDQAGREHDRNRSRRGASSCHHPAVTVLEPATHGRHQEDRVIRHEAEKQHEEKGLDLLGNAELDRFASPCENSNSHEVCNRRRHQGHKRSNDRTEMESHDQRDRSTLAISISGSESSITSN